MMTPNHEAYITAASAFWSAIGTGVAALGTVATAVIAAYATRTWKLGLQQQREDAFVDTIHNCEGAVGRVLDLAKQGHEKRWDALGEAWLIWRSFKRAVAVVRRHRKNIPDKILTDSKSVMDRLGKACSNYEQSQSAEMKSEFADIVMAVEKLVN